MLETAAELTRTLCTIAMLSAVVEVLLSGRRGASIVCMMLGFAGMAAILSEIKTIFQ